MDYIIEIFSVVFNLMFLEPGDERSYAAIGIGTAILVSAALGGLLTGGQMIGGSRKKRKAEKAQAKATADYENKLRNIEFVNKLKSLQVPTLGAELRERGIARATTGAIEATQEAGAEAVLGGVPRVVTAADAQSAEIAAQLNKMEAIRDEAVLREEQRIADQRAGIEQQIAGIDLMRAQGAGQAAADAQAQINAGAMGLAQTGTSLAVAGLQAQNPYGKQPPPSPINTTGGVAPKMSLGVNTNLSPGVAGSNALTQAGIPYVRTPNLQLQGLQPTPPLSLTSASPYSGLQFQQPNFQLQGYQSPFYNTGMVPAGVSLGLGGINE
jgi:hypothetical protein